MNGSLETLLRFSGLATLLAPAFFLVQRILLSGNVKALTIDMTLAETAARIGCIMRRDVLAQDCCSVV
jgi:hypothetical protein